VLVGKPERKRVLGIPKHKWEDNIKNIFKKYHGSCIGSIWLRIGTSGGLL
jgi:hypothetical protein